MELDWWNALVGGMLIGIAASLFYILNGRVAGISGILGGLFNKEGRSEYWRWLYILGLFVGALFSQQFINSSFDFKWDFNPYQAIIGGLLVGFGTRLGNGCTSGHGVCGIARFSLRSLSATLVFMSVAALTVFLMKYI